MMLELSAYRTLVLDCDGVILNSNDLKSEAFRKAALPYGMAAAGALVKYHIANGGVSRYRKFEYFLKEIAPVCNNGLGLNALLEQYADLVREGLMSCEIAKGIEALRALTSRARWLVVSGGDQMELREIFAQRGIDRHFDGGIFGSPDTKDAILAREIAARNIRRPALFLGDSRYDHEVATAAGLDFTFISGWSDCADWPEYVAGNGLFAVGSLWDLAQSTNKLVRRK